MPVLEHCGNDYTLISAKVPVGVYVGMASAARGEGSLFGFHHGRQQRARRVRRFIHGTHRDWVGTGAYRNVLGFWWKSHGYRRDWVGIGAYRNVLGLWWKSHGYHRDRVGTGAYRNMLGFRWKSHRCLAD